jgi:hypothetical protein
MKSPMPSLRKHDIGSPVPEIGLLLICSAGTVDRRLRQALIHRSRP